jgi:DNA modification methylase
MTSGLPLNTIQQGDCLGVMRCWPDNSVHCVVTSPPYWGLRDYGIEPSVWGGDAACEHEWGEQGKSNSRNRNKAPGGIHEDRKDGSMPVQLHPSTGCFCMKCGAWRGCYGLEPTPELFVEHTVTIFREVRRVLRDDGTLWLNLGDSYTSGGRATYGTFTPDSKQASHAAIKNSPRMSQPTGLKPKDMVGIPWRVAFALQADGWYLRQDIIWHKPNPMPDSVTDRCTKAHEYLFLMSKSPRYFYDAWAIKEPMAEASAERYGYAFGGTKSQALVEANKHGVGQRTRPVGAREPGAGRNKRSVWTIATAPFKEKHFATFPPELVRPCIRAGTSAKGCCPECGAPWKRVVEKRDTGRVQKMADGWDTGPGGHGTVHRDGREKGNAGVPVTESKTIGWRPTCKCYEPQWSERCDVLVEVLKEKARCRNTRKRERQDKAGSWRGRASRYAERWLMPREHAAFYAEPCLVFDPFGGSGTTGMVAAQEHRGYVMIERNPKYVEMARTTRLAAVETGVPAEESKAGQLSLFGSVPSVAK